MPAAAVRPQEGWYVRGTMTSDVSGVEREYFIIDNKMSADPWYVDMRTNLIRTETPILSTTTNRDGVSSDTYNWDWVAYLSDYYQGYSSSDWVVDQDWLCLLEWDGVGYSHATGFFVYLFDRSYLPSLTYQSENGNLLSTSPSALLGYSYNGSWQFGVAQAPFSGSSGSAVFEIGPSVGLSSGRVVRTIVTPFDLSLYSPQYYNSANGCSINNLCVVVVPYSTENFDELGNPNSYVQVRLAVSWAIPVDKAPAGTQVGDSWPKQRPIEVQMEDAYSAWMDSALQNTPYGDASNVGTGIQGYNQQLEESDNWGTLATEGWQGIAPIFDSFDFVFIILAIVGVTFILLLLIKKGMA